MWKKCCLLGAALAGSWLGLAGEDTLIGYWDFENGMKSGEYTLSPRGSAKIVDDADQGKALSPAAARDDKPNGVILSGAARPELAPAGPFTLSMKLKYQLPETAPEKLEYMHLWDTKYAAKGGVTLLLARTTDNQLNINLSIGNGEAVEGFQLKNVALGDGKWHELAIRLGEDNKLEILIDGAVVKTFLLAGTPAAAVQRLTIGDRVASSYGAFTGLIDEVKLTVPKK